MVPGESLLARLRPATGGTLLAALWIAMATSFAGDAPADPTRWRTEWRRFHAPEARFQVDLPGSPVYGFREDTSLLGSVGHHTYVVQHPWVRLDVERHDLPALAVLWLPARRLLDRTRDDLLVDQSAALRGEERVSLQGFPGRRLRLQREGVAHAEETRIYLAERYLYLLSAEPVEGAREDATPRAGPGPAEAAARAKAVARRFFGSFRICLEETACAEPGAVATDPGGCAPPGC